MDMDIEPNVDAFELDAREHICGTCRLVHWTPAASLFCLDVVD